MFDASGRAVRTAKVVHPEIGQPLSWLAQQDAQSRQNGQTFTPLLWQYPSMTIDDQGTVWLGETWRDDGRVRAVRVAADGAVTRADLRFSACPSRRFVIWQNAFVFYRDRHGADSGCTAVLTRSPRDVRAAR